MIFSTPVFLAIGATSVSIDIYRNFSFNNSSLLPLWNPQPLNAPMHPAYRYYDSNFRYWFIFGGIIGVSRLVGDLLLNSSFLSPSAASLSFQVVVLSIVNGLVGFAEAIYVGAVDPDQRGMTAAIAGLMCLGLPPVITTSCGVLVGLTGLFPQEQNFGAILSLSQPLCSVAVILWLIIGKQPREDD